MSEEQLRFRHSFQDFHTGPDIPDVGGRFDPDEFIATLEKARVNSVTLCARCHHGHLYYDSKVHPQLIHPNLARPNLLLEQIEACQKTTSRNHLHHGRVRLSHDPGAPRMVGDQRGRQPPFTDTQGLTSTIQTTWGDIHSFKSQACFEFECFHMLALGAKPAAGQQSHPSGKLCSATYDLIGSVFSQIEEVEPW